MIKRVSFVGAVVVALMLWAPAGASAILPVPACEAGVDRDEQVVLQGSANVPPREISGDIVVFSSKQPTTVEGTVCGDVIVFDGELLVSGTVSGDVVSFADAAAIGPKARIGGDVVYGDAKPLVSAGAIVDGDVRKFDGDDVGGAFLLIGLLLIIGVAVGSLLLGLIFLWLAPRAADAMIEPSRSAIGPAIGWGLGALIGVPLIGLLVLFTVVGIPLGIFLLLVCLPLYVIGHINGTWIVGRMIVKSPRSRVVSYVVGWVAVTAISLIPFLGGVVNLAVLVYGLGVLIVAVWRARGSGSEPGPLMPATPAPATEPPQPPPALSS